MVADTELKACKELCWATRTECMETFFTYCLKQGDTHTAPKHLKLMLDCIDSCQLAADMISRESPMHYIACEACAAICEACAASCEKIGDSRMRKCADMCRQCAAACRNMQGMRHAA